MGSGTLMRWEVSNRNDVSGDGYGGCNSFDDFIALAGLLTVVGPSPTSQDRRVLFSRAGPFVVSEVESLSGSLGPLELLAA